MTKIHNQLIALGILCCSTFSSEASQRNDLRGLFDRTPEANQRNDLRELFDRIPKGGEVKPRGPEDHELPSFQKGSSLFKVLQEITNHAINRSLGDYMKEPQTDLVRKGNYVYRFAEVHVFLKDVSHPSLWKIEKVIIERPPNLIGMVFRNGRFENGKYSDLIYKLYNSNNDFISAIRVIVTDPPLN